ncbi:SAM-dependent methyltransferase [Pseudonocardia sp. TRM90224]|uniref:SAM-dependent methyltransferase n=1 Tax=Pseudonocardia sp. TRM90224 TaxID=2812678 RepID=UPI001E33EB61|nr:SAM-dependent methyltransferase [Pseudonocardia sp. TRM90224]
MSDSTPNPHANTGIDTTVPHSARVWNYWLGGKDNYAVDRKTGDAVIAVYPQIKVNARESRKFLKRVVGFLAGEAGIRQFLDIGTGLPTADNTHEVAQRIAPDAKVVYADNDPLVLAHARALLIGTPEGETKYLHADVREIPDLMRGAAEILDFSQPVAVLMLGVLGHLDDTDEARAVVAQILDRVPSGSYLAISDAILTEERRIAEETYSKTDGVHYHARPPEAIASFFDGLEWVEPGFQSVSLWRADPAADEPETQGENVQPLAAVVPVDQWGGVARKP